MYYSLINFFKTDFSILTKSSHLSINIETDNHKRYSSMRFFGLIFVELDYDVLRFPLLKC